MFAYLSCPRLLAACKEDAAKHWMTEPRTLAVLDITRGDQCYSPRFSVEQGLTCCVLLSSFYVVLAE